MAAEESVCADGLSYGNDIVFVVVMAVKTSLAMAGCPSFLFIYAKQDCPIPGMSPYYSTLIKLLKILGYTGSTYTATGWALERALATVFINSYEQKKNFLGWVLCVLATIIAMLLVAVRYVLGEYDKLLPVTMITGHSYYLSMLSQFVSAGLEVFNVLVFFIIWIITFRRLKDSERIMSSLTYKYQLRENIIATALIFPLALLHCIAYFPTALLMPVFSLRAHNEVERFKAIAYTDCMPIYFVALPALLWWRNGAQKNSIKKMVQSNFLGEEFANKRKEGKVETAKHFEVLDQMFQGK
ncbi:hypothetical protein QR680_010999 [Steinernema hermaphroditum]|uniref:G-protein coupled receptors family 1 profile domain-containing protein n=1 Tax=Steinernema hermaphroditum TaxID=289476 RepID=A0AA39MCM0_9BILA|nr:hypothetical protein QR680_010999 [Steinernema hermaphroditum]